MKPCKALERQKIELAMAFGTSLFAGSANPSCHFRRMLRVLESAALCSNTESWSSIWSLIFARVEDLPSRP